MKRFAVIGLGKFGFHMARVLFEEGNEVIAIDRSPDRVQEIDPYCTEAIVLESNYELAYYDRRSSIITKEQLLVAPPAGAASTPRAVEPGQFTRSVPEMKNPD